MGQQSSEFVARLDQHWSKPPGVLAEAYCQLCVEPYRSDPRAEVTWLLNGVNVFNEPAVECEERPSDTSPEYEQLGLNTLNKHWPEAKSAAARAALHSAKVAWTGPLYFARALRDHLPPDILDRVVELATSYQQLVSAPSNVRQHCPFIRRARKPTVPSKVQHNPNRKHGKKRKKRCKNKIKTWDFYPLAWSVAVCCLGPADGFCFPNLIWLVLSLQFLLYKVVCGQWCRQHKPVSSIWEIVCLLLHWFNHLCWVGSISRLHVSYFAHWMSWKCEHSTIFLSHHSCIGH